MKCGINLLLYHFLNNARNLRHLIQFLLDFCATVVLCFKLSLSFTLSFFHSVSPPIYISDQNEDIFNTADFYVDFPIYVFILSINSHSISRFHACVYYCYRYTYLYWYPFHTGLLKHNFISFYLFECIFISPVFFGKLARNSYFLSIF